MTRPASIARSYVVLGGCGVIGRTVVRDLLASDRRNRVLIADYDGRAAASYARNLRSRRARGVLADASKPAALARLLRGHAAVLNCVQHDFNLRVMRAALEAGVHYVDLGGLFHWTRRQLRLDARFRRAGLVAILGGGCAPGITNVLARLVCDRLDRVETIRIRVGAVDRAPRPAGFVFPYSAQTIVEEMTLKPWIFRGGRFRAIAPRSKWERVRFPAPVGRQWCVCTRHSEIATIPLSFRAKGVRACDFMVSFDRAFVRELVRRLEAGWTVRDFAKLPAPRGKPDDVEVARVEVKGWVGGRRRVIVADCQAKPKRAWHASAGDIDTGCPPSILAQMIAGGLVAEPGVHAPESVVPVNPFLRELRRRGMRVTVRLRRASA